MMYRCFIACILAIGLVIPVEGETRGERYILLNEIQLEDIGTLEKVTSLLKDNNIPYVINLSYENIQSMLDSEEIVVLVKEHIVLNLPISYDLYSQEKALKVMNFESILSRDYKHFIHSPENLGIMVDVGREDIEEILRLFIVNEVPIDNLGNYSEHIQAWQLTETNLFPDTQAIDMTNTNKIITVIMFITVIIFVIFIAEARKRERKKFFDKE